MKKSTIAALLFIACSCPILRAQDSGGIFYPYVRTVRHVTADPATCLPTSGNIILRTDTDTLKICSATNTWTAVGAGTGDTVGPASSTDNAIARFDSTTGKLLQNSIVTLSDAGVFLGATSYVDTSSGTSNRLVLSNATGPVLATDNTADEVVRNLTFDMSLLDGNRNWTIPNNAGTVAVGTFTGTGTVYVRQASPTITTPTLNGITQLGPVLFAALGTPADGAIAFCSDCTKATPCADSGTGALAKRLNGAWDCD